MTYIIHHRSTCEIFYFANISLLLVLSLYCLQLFFCELSKCNSKHNPFLFKSHWVYSFAVPNYTLRRWVTQCGSSSPKSEAIHVFLFFFVFFWGHPDFRTRPAIFALSNMYMSKWGEINWGKGLRICSHVLFGISECQKWDRQLWGKAGQSSTFCVSGAALHTPNMTPNGRILKNIHKENESMMLLCATELVICVHVYVLCIWRYDSILYCLVCPLQLIRYIQIRVLLILCFLRF